MRRLSDVYREPGDVPENPSSADPVHRRPCRVPPRTRSRVPRPSQRHRQGFRPRSDAQTQPGVRHEVPHAGRVSTPHSYVLHILICIHPFSVDKCVVKLESDVCCRLQVAPFGESYGGNRRPGRK